MRNWPQWLKGVLVLTLSFEMAACGTIFYPERRGQKEGHLDVGVVLLDGIGLFFFLIPGIIAYVVDFGDGTIYFPAGDTRKAGLGRHDPKIVKFDPQNYTPESLTAIIQAQTGYRLDWRDKRLKMVRLSRKDEVPLWLARAGASAEAESSTASFLIFKTVTQPARTWGVE